MLSLDNNITGNQTLSDSLSNYKYVYISNKNGAINVSQFIPVGIFKKYNSNTKYVTLFYISPSGNVYSELFYIDDNTVNIIYNDVGIELYGIK